MKLPIRTMESLVATTTTKKPLYYSTNIEAKFNKDGNTKVGKTIWTWNKLAGSGEMTDTTTGHSASGTCGKYCKSCYNPESPSQSPCYVFKSYMYPSVVHSHIRNTLALRLNPDEAFNQLKSQLTRARNKPTAIRIHASGELETADELRRWFKLAEEFPTIPFYIYTKAYDILNKVLPKTTPPNNFIINVSIWHEEGINCYNKWKHYPTVKAFIYEDKSYDYSVKNPELKITGKCPAYEKDGTLKHNLTCDKCKLCFKPALTTSSRNKAITCYSH